MSYEAIKKKMEEEARTWRADGNRSKVLTEQRDFARRVANLALDLAHCYYQEYDPSAEESALAALEAAAAGEGNE